MKRLLALLLIGAMSLSAVACGSVEENNFPAATEEEVTTETEEAVTEEISEEAVAADITLWTYPIGKFDDPTTVNEIITAFNEKYPDVNVSVEYLNYTSGDDKVAEAIENGTAPDIVFEGPERLVANWGAKGKLVDLEDLWTADTVADVVANSAAVEAACKSPEGIYYEYPLCMTTHTMVINKEIFEKAGAFELINSDRTWTTENFEKALQLIKDSGLVEKTGIVYCGGNSGDQGTRALAMNLYNAEFTSEDHTEYIMNEEAGVKGLQQLVDWCEAGLLSYDANMVATDEIPMFSDGMLAMSFCWNAVHEESYKEAIAESGFTPYAVAFPSDDGVPELCGGIWGFGIFDNGDAAKVSAAKAFIRFVCDDPVQGPKSVIATNLFPVRASLEKIYAGTEEEERMTTYGSFAKWLGDYYYVTPGWAEQRIEWWKLLQRIFDGGDVQTEADIYNANCAAATAETLD